MIDTFGLIIKNELNWGVHLQFSHTQISDAKEKRHTSPWCAKTIFKANDDRTKMNVLNSQSQHPNGKSNL